MWEQQLADCAAVRHGIISAPVVSQVGVPDHVVAYLRRRGLLVPIGRGVDRMRDHPFDFAARCQAALDLAGDGAALGRRTAARLHEWYRYRHVELVEVLVRRGRDQRTCVGSIVQTRWLPERHVEVVAGFPVTTPARTFFDLAGAPPPGLSVNHPVHERHLRAVYNDCVARRGLTFTQEAAVLLVMAKRGRSGTALTRRILERYGPEWTPTHSDTETLFLELVEAYEVPLPERQVPISGTEGWIGTVDFCWPDAWHIVEVDSCWHDGPEDVIADTERDAGLRAAGYTVQRYRYGELVSRPAAIARELGVAVRR